MMTETQLLSALRDKLRELDMPDGTIVLMAVSQETPTPDDPAKSVAIAGVSIKGTHTRVAPANHALVVLANRVFVAGQGEQLPQVFR